MTIRTIFAQTLRHHGSFALTARLAHWRRISRSRTALARLGPRLLSDVGLGAGAAEREARKPFWRD
ncbi:hypothetical protein DEA8626_02172 [Defluviimonas aquaemixtae]|uniref:YjiS-like domain-containing protein n=1 Tax=Albidovulum aquaemixtae TaxID=1542388 RepID=A0A2R8B7V7_9RHOB|nr:DUF1127 domain-containing protein [Defluviimonas aquaemixtae]SPH18632.1 hypothetical protein DEA8626_02172 [Defluviimonas aquaemixtae]